MAFDHILKSQPDLLNSTPERIERHDLLVNLQQYVGAKSGRCSQKCGKVPTVGGPPPAAPSRDHAGRRVAVRSAVPAGPRELRCGMRRKSFPGDHIPWTWRDGTRVVRIRFPDHVRSPFPTARGFLSRSPGNIWSGPANSAMPLGQAGSSATPSRPWSAGVSEAGWPSPIERSAHIRGVDRRVMRGPGRRSAHPPEDNHIAIEARITKMTVSDGDLVDRMAKKHSVSPAAVEVALTALWSGGGRMA